MPKKPKKTLRWRLALDLGSTSLDWAMLRLARVRLYETPNCWADAAAEDCRV